MTAMRITLIGSPTALIELDGFRLLTDPTFDAVLLSHDQHADNLDRSGRAFLDQVGRVPTTTAGACRLGARVEGLAPWSTKELVKTSGRSLRITATPARHGPAGIEPLAGDVIGFIVASADAAARPIYITGDTVWYDGVAEVARRFRPAAARAGRRNGDR